MGESRGWLADGRYRFGALVVLFDRTLIGILAPAIKGDLRISDAQVGLLGGTAFALFYTAMGVPIAWLADRFNRVKIILTALLIWSGFTMLCGMGQNFLHLFLLRVGVGVGEAGGAAPSLSLVADTFPTLQRGRALAAFAFAWPMGSAMGIVVGGVLNKIVDWRTIFIIFGAAGIALAPLLRLMVREPRQPHVSREHVSRGREGPPVTPSMGKSLRLLLAKPEFVLVMIGAGFATIPSVAVYLWMPSFFQRSYGMSVSEVGLHFGMVVLVGGVAGTWTGGWLSDRLALRNPRVGRLSYLIVPAVAWLLAIPTMAFCLLVHLTDVAFLLLSIPIALTVSGNGSLPGAVQFVVPDNLRTTALGLYILATNLIGFGVGVPVLGLISDFLRERLGVESLRYALLLGVCLYPLAAVCLLIAVHRLRSTIRPPVDVGRDMISSVIEPVNSSANRS